MIATAVGLEKRFAVLHEAEKWLGTPYHHNAAVRGVGVDCARFPLEVYAAAGLVEHFDAGQYSRQWMLHRSEELYLDMVRDKGGREVEQAEPGDLIVMRFGRTYSHGAIVVDDAKIIHSRINVGVVIDDLAEFVDRKMKFFSVVTE